mgnify:CR=1 FL=1
MQCRPLKRCHVSRLFLFFLSVMFCSGCLTSRNTKAIDDYSSSINEFDRALPDKGNFHVDVGTLSVVNGVTVMQFAKILRGEQRFLNIESTAQGMRFLETSEKVAGTRPAYLIRQVACCMEDKAFREILFLKPGQKADPAELLQKHFQQSSAPLEYPTAIVVMDFSNVYTFSAMHAFWQNSNAVTYFVQSPGSDYNEVMKDVAWQKRSRLRLAGLYAFYAVTVPVDIVTVPFQIAGLLLMGRGVVR